MTPAEVRRTVSEPPLRVVTVVLVSRGRFSAYTRLGMTWYVSTADSAVMLPDTEDGTAAKAAFRGANTV